MPRHRSERPRHRAQHPTRERVRRAQFPAVAARPPSHAKPGTSPSDRLAELGARVWPYQRRLLAGAMRGLVVSPWFAAGAGFVVAAGAFIYAPHADLDFGNGAVRLTPCTVAGCQQLIPAGVQPPEAAGGGTPLPTPTPAASGHTHSGSAGSPASSAAHSPTFAYTMSPVGQGKFQMTLTVTSSQAVGAWWLSFEVPGASALSVTGASWESTGTDSGTASGQAAPVGDLAPGAGQPDVVTFVVDGDGHPDGPVNCVFHDVQGKFSPEFSQS